MKRILFLLVLLSGPAWSQEEKIDYVNLGAGLLKDGYTERARIVLEKADISKQGFDFSRYYTLKGIVLHKLSYPTVSNIFIDEAIKRGQDNPSVYLYKARNYWLLQDYPAVITALDKAGDAAKESPQYLIIKAESFKRLDDYKNSWTALDHGIELFDDPSPFYRLKFHYLLELGYSQAALDYADKYLQSSGYTSKEYLAVAYMLRENGDLDDAARLLEEAVIKYSNDERLIELLSQVYIDQQHYSMAAQVLDWAAIRYPHFSLKAATLYLKAKQPIRSMQLNRRVSDQKEKFRQRLGIDIYLDDYETLVAKTSALKRYDLLREDSIVYAVGYGYFKIGDYENAKKYLKKITDGQLFAKASQVFQLIEKCQNEVLECY